MSLPQVRSWFCPLSHLLSRMRFLFLHSSTIVSVADLDEPNLPVHNKLIFAKISRAPETTGLLDRFPPFWYTSSHQNTPHGFSIPEGRKGKNERSKRARSALFSTAGSAWAIGLSSPKPWSTKLPSSREEPAPLRQRHECIGNC